MKSLRQGLAAAFLTGTTALALAGDVVVLKGGAVIELKQPWVRRGNTAYLTRADGTLLSVPVGEIDRDATAAAAVKPASQPAPAEPSQPSTPAEAVRTVREGPKARVKITDADVSHPLDLSETLPQGKKEQPGGPARVEIAQYTQDLQGQTLYVKGQLRNPTQYLADDVKMTVTAIDEKGQAITAEPASLSNGQLESAATVEFSVPLAVGDRTVASLRFAPTWKGPRPTPAPTPRANAAAAARAAAAAEAPQVRPTPYGRGNIYPAPVANAPMSPQADGSGYIPGAASTENQPKPPQH
ncbi:MAG: hypothetical protein ABI968_00065 [Acidobacteriota bacterium]